MGKFKPGQSGNPAGRPAGSTNRVTLEVKTALADSCTEYFTGGQFLRDMAGLKPRDRVREMRQFLDFILPRTVRQESSIDLSKLSDTEIDKLLSRALKIAEDG